MYIEPTFQNKVCRTKTVIASTFIVRHVRNKMFLAIFLFKAPSIYIITGGGKRDRTICREIVVRDNDFYLYDLDFIN